MQNILDERIDEEVGADAQEDTASVEVVNEHASDKPRRPELLLVPDARLNLMVLSGRSQDVALVRELLSVLDQPGSPIQIATIPKPCLVPLKHVNAQHVCEVVQAVFASYIDSNQAGLMPIAGMPFGGQPAIANQPQPRMTVAVDHHGNRLVVSAPDELLRDVIQLAESIDANHEAVSVKTCTRLSPAVVEQALSLVLAASSRLVCYGAGCRASWHDANSGTAAHRSGTARRRTVCLGERDERMAHDLVEYGRDQYRGSRGGMGSNMDQKKMVRGRPK